MGYDPEVAERVRAALADREVREVRMFGGLAFMVDGRMLVCASSGGLLVRVDPAEDAEHLTRPGAARAEMGRGRPMGEGWITADRAVLSTDEDLAPWLAAALSFHASGAGVTRPGKRTRVGREHENRPES
ncbi:TfoX/Sxy family protein [Thalassiella azotivora]